MASIGDSIYMIGGRICRKDNEHSDVEVEVRPTVMRYNVGTDQWSVCAPLSRPRYNFACTVCNDKIYVAGGQYELASARSTSSVEVYDPMDDKWTQLPNMRRLRYKCVGVTWKGKVHVVGGFVQGCEVECQLGYVDRCSAEVYDGEGQWDLVPGMWQLDVPPNQIVDVEGKLFSSGDCLSVWKGHIEIYDGNSNFWNVFEALFVIESVGLLEELNFRWDLIIRVIDTEIWSKKESASMIEI
ncbi:F-box/kelch-repeat protein At1g16250-like [Salvia miltiorrhiza]|uniref:F-box/kelch-repeat protein At1g16250-like n=1 Tax=Salvia miltiorrhiza TaxID=226208 RepID=UPI0025AD0EA4|nr:F-box/kelch-repeat protein At1g16250-like [Salvia miltiorrhiza]